MVPHRSRLNPWKLMRGGERSMPRNVSNPLGGKTTMAIATMLAVLAVPYRSPRLSRFRVAHAPWDKTEAKDDTPKTTDAPVLTQGETQLKASQNVATVTNALPDDSASKAKELDPK